MRAERDLRVGRDQTTLWSVLGYRVVHLSADPANWPISRLRPGSAVLTPAPQPGVLARSSGLGCLVRGVRSLPQPPGSRVARALVQKDQGVTPPPRVWPAGRSRVLHVASTPGHDETPGTRPGASPCCDEQQGEAGAIAKCRSLCFRAAAACTPPSRGQPRLDSRWQDDRGSRSCGSCGVGRLKCASAPSPPALGPSALREPPHAHPIAPHTTTHTQPRNDSIHFCGNLRVISRD